MKPETRTVTELFERDVRYVVPLYQRSYVWNEQRQWEPLWEDIVVLLTHQLANSSGIQQPYSHFMGAIVLEQQMQAPGKIPLYVVIDGQQRLTTLQILLAASSHAAMKLGADREAGLLHDLTRNDKRKATGTELLKVWPTNANRDAFAAVLNVGGPPLDRQDDPKNRIDEAYQYFLRRAHEWLEEDGNTVELVQPRVEILRVALSDLLKLVSITLEPTDNAQVIFETLNARGTPLLALDLVKNAVFHEAERQKLDVDELYERVWRPELDDGYWRKERRQGRLYRAQAELFLMHWLGMKLRRVIPATELFATFRKEILQVEPKPSTDALIRTLCRDASILRSFDSQPAGSPEAIFFERLEALDVTTVMPLVLLLFTESAISADRRRRALRILESWLVRRALMRLTTKHYNEEIADLLSQVGTDASHADRVILQHFRNSTGDISRWPADAELMEHLCSEPSYGYIPQARIAMALLGVERSLLSKKVEDLPLPKHLSIEHLMPQQWEKNWPLPKELQADHKLTAIAERNAKVQRLGNLTLTTQPLNTALSNSPWDKKKGELNRGSKLLINVEILESYPKTFDERSIDKRTKMLAKRIAKIWPGPEADW